jgi:hypothetical protein
VISLYGVDIPVSFLLSNYQRNFKQPFNKFGISPYYKNLKVHLGYRNVRFSPFTLNGHTFLGAGVEYHPGIFRLGVVYGRFLKAIEEDPEYTIGNDLTRTPQPSFRRTAYAIKFGIGSEANHVDLVYLKGKDDENSLDEIPQIIQTYPAENAVFGISSKFTIAKKLVLKGDVGASAYTRDIRQDALDIGESEVSKVINKILAPKYTSQGFLAGEGSIEYREDKFSMELKYRRVDPGYKTMGAYYFQTDLEQYLIGTSFQGKTNKFRFRGSLGLQFDNLRDNKSAQTKRTIGSASLSIQPVPAFGMDIQYSNFGVSQNPGLKSISDTTRLRNVNRTIVLAPRLNIRSASFSHSVNLVGGYTDLNDKNSYTREYTEVQSLHGNILYSITHMNAGFTVSLGTNLIKTTLPVGETTARGYSAGLSKSLAKGKFQARVQYIRNSNRFEETENGFTSRMTAGLNFRPAADHTFKAQYSRLKNESENSIVSRSFTETTTRITYTYRFNTRKKLRK